MLEVGEVLLLDGYLLAQTSRLDVGCGDGDGIVVDVVSVDVMLEVVLARLVFVDAVEEFLVEVGPLLEGIFLAIDTWCDASGVQLNWGYAAMAALK